DAGTIAWPADLVADGEGTRWELFTAPEGGLAVEDGTVTGGECLGDLTLRDEPLDSSELSGRAHLEGFLALDLPELDRSVLEAALRGELAVAQYRPDGIEVVTGVQIPSVLDDLYAAGAADQERGVRWQVGASTRWR